VGALATSNKSEAYLAWPERSGGKTEDGRRKTEDGRRKTEDGRRSFGVLKKFTAKSFKPMKIDSWKDLDAYKNSFELQQEIFDHSKSWPKGETYSLIDQIRRSSRTVGSNITEAWAKRRYPAHFISKLTHADGELQETLHWLASAEACRYIDSAASSKLQSQAETIGKQLGRMINKHESFCF
jgi:four helix bundle protein